MVKRSRSDEKYGIEALEILKTMDPPRIHPDAHIGDPPGTPRPPKKRKPKPKKET